jgi:hypothetical protein
LASNALVKPVMLVPIIGVNGSHCTVPLSCAWMFEISLLSADRKGVS